ncbi:Cytochrome P450 monooxygenase [Pseudocercospora fuligena]|uniref:Cytochrome P450 monooxygenase n=1 Tax=Pseudocercospora fuligena TaxID=685502 RepID=A0A8H6R8D9_9PEZI|nr:Cytochrome P450 monooxygenase [Pseudocercospora fuligena]
MGISTVAPLLALFVAVSSIVWGIVYNLYFHPLAKFPGPRLNAASSLPGIFALLKGRLPLENKKLHEKYGSVVRVSPNELAFNSVQAWEDIYGHRPGHTNMHKDPIHVGSVEAVQGVSTLTMSDDDNHARQRRALAHSFSQKALLEQEYIVKRYVDQLITGAIEQATRRFAAAGSLTQRILFNMIPARVRGYRSEHLRRSRAKCLQRLENGNSQHKDFIWYILKQREKHDLKQDEIIVNSALFIVAGSETTANLLSGLFARLIWNPDKYQRLVDEIRSSFKSEDEIVYEKLSKLTYLNACIEEGLRIHPPVPTGLLRTVPKEGDTIDGQWIPGGTSVAVGGWAASHNPVNFRDCDSFIPERWLDKAYDTDYKKAAQPFSLGPRGCIGRHLSYMEMRLILGRLLYSFDVVSTDGAWQWDPEGEMKNMRAFMTWEKPDLNAKVKLVQR